MFACVLVPEDGRRSGQRWMNTQLWVHNSYTYQSCVELSSPKTRRACKRSREGRGFLVIGSLGCVQSNGPGTVVAEVHLAVL